MGSIFRNLFRKKSKSGKSNTPGPHTPPIPTPNHPRPPPSAASSAAPPSALKKQLAPPLAPVPEDGTIPIAAEPFADDRDDRDTQASSSKLSTSPYTMASAAASLRSVASVATLRPDPRAQLSSDDEFMSSDSDSADETERERRRRKKEKKAGGKKSKAKKHGRSKKEDDELPKAKKAGSSASGSTASVSVAGSGSTRGSSSHHPQRSRQGSVASTHPHTHTYGHHHRPPTPPLGSAHDGPFSAYSSSDDDNGAPVALDPVLLARARLGSASSTHLPFAHHPPSRSASPAPGLAAGGPGGAQYYQGYPSPGLTNSSAAGSRRGSPAGLIGLASAPLSPMHPNFHAHHATVAAQHHHMVAGAGMSSPLAPGMMRPAAGAANLAYAPLGGGGLRTSPSMTSLHSAYAAGAGYPSRSGSPMVASPYHASASGGHHQMLRASPSMTSLHSAYASGGGSLAAAPARPPTAPQLGPGSRFAFPPMAATASAGNTPNMSAVDLTFRGAGGPGLGGSDSDEDEIIGLRAMRAGRGGYFLNGSASVPGSPARSRAGSNASSVLTAGMANMSLAQAAADEGGEGKREKKDKKGGGKAKKDKRDKEGKKKKAAAADGGASVKSGTKTKSAAAAPPAAPAAPAVVTGKDTFYGASPHLPQGTMSAFGPGTFVPFPSPASTSASSDQSSSGSSGKYHRAGGGVDARAPIGVGVGARGY